MGTISVDASLGTLLFGKARRAILALTFGRPEASFYVRQVARYAAAGNGVVQRELESLAAAGVLTRRPSGRQVYYRANPDCPIFEELRSIIIKTAGVADVLREALLPLSGKISVAFIYGSFAGGGHPGPLSDIDVMVVGEVTFSEVSRHLFSAQRVVGREANPTVYPDAEFRSKVATRNAFLSTVMRGPKIFLIGDSLELERLATKRLARRAPPEC